MANVTYTVPNKNGSYDGDMVVKQYTSVTIDAGDTVTVDQPCRGLLMYCKGNMVVNGTLSMSARGPLADPTSSGGSDSNAVSTNGLQYGFFDGSSTDTLTMDGTSFNGCGTTARTAIANALSGSGTGFKVHTISRVGSAGQGDTSVGGDNQQENPQDIRGTDASSNNRTGSGGTGGQGYFASAGRGGNGAAGTCWTGGSGGGGGATGGGGNTGIKYGRTGTAYGGAGGQGGSDDESSYSRAGGAGGAGNPGGVHGQSGYNSLASHGDTGNGGLIILVVGGNLTIGANGSIVCNGVKGGFSYNGSEPTSNSSTDNGGGGAGSGGGHILIICKGTVTANGSTISAGDYVGNAGSQVGSTDSHGYKYFNLQAWGGRGGYGCDGKKNTADPYDGSLTTTTRQGGWGGRGHISIYTAA